MSREKHAEARGCPAHGARLSSAGTLRRIPKKEGKRGKSGKARLVPERATVQKGCTDGSSQVTW